MKYIVSIWTNDQIDGNIGKQFEILEISKKVKRFSAIKPTHDERWNRSVPWGKGKYAYPLKGAVGCADSHKTIIKDCQRKKS